MNPNGATWKDVVRYSVKRVLQQSIYMAINTAVGMGLEEHLFDFSPYVGDLEWLPFTVGEETRNNAIQGAEDFVSKKIFLDFLSNKVIFRLDRSQYNEVEKKIKEFNISDLYT